MSSGNGSVRPAVRAAWTTWDGAGREDFSLRWENGGYVAEGHVTGVEVDYVIRLGPEFRTRQFLLFRDVEEPDLWLAADGQGGWGEVNGAAREDLQGCFDIDLGCSPFTNSIPVRSLDLAVGEAARLSLAWIDVETLAIEASPQTYTRLADRRWRFEAHRWDFTVEFDVDEHGLVLDYPGLFRRAMAR